MSCEGVRKNVSKSWSAIFRAAGVLIFVVSASTAPAAFITSGEVIPADPSTWLPSTTARVGYTTTGALTVDGGNLISYTGYLGYNSGSTGTATVAGAGSIWTNSHFLHVGRYGNGTLNVEAGGQVSSNVGFLGYESGSTGTATVTGAGSKWTNSSALHVGGDGNGTLTVSNGGVVSAKTLYTSSLSNLLGDGTISINGIVLDADLIFDGAQNGPNAFGTGGALNLDLDGSGNLGAGYEGAGTLRIADGVAVASSAGYLGYAPGSNGTATVTGTDSKWTSRYLYVGNYGSGTLNIEAGAQVSNTTGFLGVDYHCTGTVMITGTDSKWINSGDLYLGLDGTGTVNQTG